MKTLRIVFSRIGTYFSRNKTVFVLYIVGMIICVTSLIFLYGNFLGSKPRIYSHGLSCKRVEVYFEDPVLLTKDDISEIQDFYMEGKIQEIELSTVLDKNGNDSIEFFSGDEDVAYGDDVPASTMDYIGGYTDLAAPNDYIIVDSYLNNNDDMMVNPRPNIFSNDQLKQFVAVAPKEKTGSIKILGEDFKIIENVSSDHYAIPIEKYLSLNLRTCYLNIQTDTIWSKFAISEYVNYLKAIFDKANYRYTICDPLPFYGQLENMNLQYTGQIMLVSGCTILAFMFLLKYLMDCSRYENGVLMMVGAKRKHIVFMGFIENIILTLSSTIVAIFIHIGFYNVFFSKVNIFEELEYYPHDYVIIAGMILATSIIVQIPFMIVYWKNNIKNIKEGGR